MSSTSGIANKTTSVMIADTALKAFLAKTKSPEKIPSIAFSASVSITLSFTYVFKK